MKFLFVDFFCLNSGFDWRKTNLSFLDMEVKIVKKGEFERYVYLINDNPDDVFIVHEKLVDNTWVIIGKVVIPRIVMEKFTDVNSSRSDTIIELPYTQVDPWFSRTVRSVINLSWGNLPIGSDTLSEGVREEFAAYRFSKIANV